MTTLGDVVRRIEHEVFVGRDQEIAILERWLDGTTNDCPAIMTITGRGGVGKTTLLRRLESYAADRGMAVVHLDGADFVPTLEGLLLVLGADSMEEAVDRFSDRLTLITVDSFELLGPLVPVLRDQLLTALPAVTKVVVSGRAGLDDRQWRHWGALIDRLQIEPFARAAARAYLARRGMTDQGKIEATVLATKGMPLALALAADVMQRDPERGVESTDDWAGLLRGLVAEVAGEVSESQSRDVIDAACVVRRFDYDLIEHILERPCAEEVDRLSQLSFVQQGRHGLVIHDEIRTILESDLRHRDRARHERYRERARERYQQRMARRVSSAGRASLMFDALGLDRTVEPYLPPSKAEPTSQVTPYRPVDKDAVLRVMRECREHHPVGRAVAIDERSEELLGRILDWPSSVVDVARTAAGEIHGFAFLLPLARTTCVVLGEESQIAAAFRLWSELAHREIPERAAESRVSFLSSVQYGVEEPELANVVLMEHGYSLILRGGVFLALTSHEFYAKALMSVGARRVASLENSVDGADPLGLFELDIDAFGLEAWTQALLAGKQPVRRLTSTELEAAVQAALVRWRDDEALAASPLSRLTAGEPPGAEGVRELLRSVMNASKAVELELPMHAVQLAYIERTGSIERVAEQLHVSRATLFRLLKRGVRDVAMRLEARDRR